MAQDIVKRIEAVLLESETEGKPLEVDPQRSRLFELFVTAEGAGYLDQDAEIDLTSDELCRILADRWGLAEAARESHAQQNRLAGRELARMRQLWSLLRMWMEWTYAWSRWPEFHKDAS